LSAVAIGQALVMNPDWVAYARQGDGEMPPLAIAADAVTSLAIPPKLWRIIEETPGWFPARAAA
jgi:2,4-dienoyl-CoA reductase-like NADH-dependent reductase (Old Yellow Enzyme family)